MDVPHLDNIVGLTPSGTGTHTLRDILEQYAPGATTLDDAYEQLTRAAARGPPSVTERDALFEYIVSRDAVRGALLILGEYRESARAAMARWLNTVETLRSRSKRLS